MDGGRVMAIKKSHEIVIHLRTGLIDVSNQYTEVLSEQDLLKLHQSTIQVFSVKNAYHRVEQMQVSKECINFTLAIYNANATKLIESKQYNFAPDTSETALNYHKQCYIYVKSLDEYTDAVDC